MISSELMKILGTLLTIFAFICVGCLFSYLVVKYNRTGSKKFNFLTYFPFELNSYRRYSSTKYIDISFMIITIILSLSPIVIFAFYYNLATSYILLAVFTLEIITFGILFFTKLSNYKLHIGLAIAFTCLQIVFSLLSFTFFTDSQFGYVLSDKAIIFIIIIVILQLIFEFILLLNPTYKDWYKKFKFDAETFSRPKYNYLAMLEWGTFLNLCINYIVILIVNFF